MDSSGKGRTESFVHSAEHIENDDELVRRAVLRRKRTRFTIPDLFNLFGPFDAYFKISITMACLMYTPQVLESVVKITVMVPDTIFTFHDCNANGYGDSKKHSLHNITVAELDSESFKTLHRIVDIISPLVCLLFHRTSIRSTLLFFSIVGVVNWTCFLSKQMYFINISRIAAQFTKTSYKILVFRYITSSVPYNLIVVSFYCLELTTDFVLFFVLIALKRRNDWLNVPWAPLLFYILSTVIFYCAAPTPILQSIIQKNSLVLQQLIRKYTGIEKFDSDGLIDDVLYKNKNLITDDFMTSIGCYFVKAHLVRQMAYALYQTMVDVIVEISIYCVFTWVAIDFFSSMLLLVTCSAICTSTAVVILYRIRVRKTLWVGCLATSVGLLVVFLRPTSGHLNACRHSANFVHTEAYVPWIYIGLICTALGLSIFRLSKSLMISTFFPVQHQPILLPIHYFGSNILRAFLEIVAENDLIINKKITRAVECVVILLALGVLSAIMESEHYWTVVTTTDVLKLKVISSEYPDSPDCDDDSFYDLTDQPLRSDRIGPIAATPAKEKAVTMFRGIKRKQKRSAETETPTGSFETPTTISTVTARTKGSADVVVVKKDLSQENIQERSDNRSITGSAEATAGARKTTDSESTLRTPMSSKEDAENRYAASAKATRQIASDP